MQIRCAVGGCDKPSCTVCVYNLGYTKVIEDEPSTVEVEVQKEEVPRIPTYNCAKWMRESRGWPSPYEVPRNDQ